ncbi:hypothetical protein SUGI_1082550 [Cryptomeria japonica]|nr:hypothetical protein SUGI_1082550 [Cryptomeria japonica]
MAVKVKFHAVREICTVIAISYLLKAIRCYHCYSQLSIGRKALLKFGKICCVNSSVVAFCVFGSAPAKQGSAKITVEVALHFWCIKAPCHFQEDFGSLHNTPQVLQVPK